MSKRRQKVHRMAARYVGQRCYDGSVWGWNPAAGRLGYAVCGVRGRTVLASSDPAKVTCKRCF